METKPLATYAGYSMLRPKLNRQLERSIKSHTSVW